MGPRCRCRSLDVRGRCSRSAPTGQGARCSGAARAQTRLLCRLAGGIARCPAPRRPSPRFGAVYARWRAAPPVVHDQGAGGRPRPPTCARPRRSRNSADRRCGGGGATGRRRALGHGGGPRRRRPRPRRRQRRWPRPHPFAAARAQGCRRCHALPSRHGTGLEWGAGCRNPLADRACAECASPFRSVGAGSFPSRPHSGAVPGGPLPHPGHPADLGVV